MVFVQRDFVGDEEEPETSSALSVVSGMEAVAVGPDGDSGSAATAGRELPDGHKRYSVADTFRGAIMLYLKEQEIPPQWNPWQKMAYALATEFTEQLPPNARTNTGYFSELYNSTMKERYGANWRAMRRQLQGASSFAVSAAENVVRTRDEVDERTR